MEIFWNGWRKRCQGQNIKIALSTKARLARNDRFVVKHDDGWAVKKTKAGRSSSVHPTEKEAEKRAKQIVDNLGGGEVRIQGKSGPFRDSDTRPRGNDPNPPRDRRH